MNQKLRVLVCVAILQGASAFADQVLINEIMYHPAPAIPEDPGQEWIELYNKGTNAINLSGGRLTKSISFTFTNRPPPAGGYLVVAANTNTFALRYPAVANVVGNWVGSLAN